LLKYIVTMKANRFDPKPAWFDCPHRLWHTIKVLNDTFVLIIGDAHTCFVYPHSSIRKTLSPMLDHLAGRLQTITQGLDWDLKDTLTEADVDAACRQVRRALLEADVNLRAIESFLVRVKEKAVGQNLLDAISPEQQFIGLLSQELTLLLGQDHQPLDLSGSPSLILFFGLQGCGKTTTVAKLGVRLKEEGKKPLLVAADTVRPAAIGQLKQLGQQTDVPVFDLPGETDMLAIAQAALVFAKANDHDVVLVDTAGRLQVDTSLMADLLILERALAPQERLLVIDAMMGQEAVPVAQAFDTHLNLTGLILTKLDGDARGGAVLSVVEATGKPIKWVGVGETMLALEPFHPDRMASRVLGMGDIQTLFERAQSSFDASQNDAMIDKFRGKQFNFLDFMSMQHSMTKLGSFDQILSMLPIPGLDKSMKHKVVKEGEAAFKQAKVIIDSMTQAERLNPELLNASRKVRIAHGAGLRLKEVEAFMEKFEQMREQMKQMTDMMDLFSGKTPLPDADTPDEDDSPIDWSFLTGAFGGGDDVGATKGQLDTSDRPLRTMTMPGKKKNKKAKSGGAFPGWPF
jgi:signal recognition particle subunit SRP54